MALLTDFKCFEFHQKEGFYKAGTHKDGAEKSVVAQKISIKKKPGSLCQESRKDDLMISEKSVTSHPSQAKRSKRLVLRREAQTALPQKDHPGNWFPKIQFIVLSHLGTERSLQPQ